MTPEPVNWWLVIHKALTELPWGAPEHVLGMTLPQLACLCHERPPGGPKRLESAEDVAAMLEQRAAAERVWSE